MLSISFYVIYSDKLHCQKFINIRKNIELHKPKIYTSNFSSVNLIDIVFITHLLTWIYLRNHYQFLMGSQIFLDWMSFNGAHNILILFFILVQIFGYDVEALNLRLDAHHVHANSTCRCLMGFLSSVLWTVWNEDVIADIAIIRSKLLIFFII